MCKLGNSVVSIALLLCMGNIAALQEAEAEPDQQVIAGGASAQAAESDLGTILMQNANLQDATIIALRTALGARGQVVAVRRGRFADDVRVHVEIYRGIQNPSILANIQNRYSSARSELLEARLPETVAELVAVLEDLL